MRFLLNLSIPAPQCADKTQSANASRMSLFRGRGGHGRSSMKAVSWRTVGTLDAFILPRAT